MSAVGRLWERAAPWRWLSSFALITAALVTYLELTPTYRPATGNSASFKPGTTVAGDAAVATRRSGAQTPPATAVQGTPASVPDRDRSIASTTPDKDKTTAPAAPDKPKTIAPVAPDASLSTVQGGLMGKSFTDSMTYEGLNILLPAGTWTVVAFQRGGPQAPASGAVVLARIAGKKLGGLVAINAYQDPQNRGSGFPQTNFCSRADYVFRETKSNEPFGNQECWWINHASRMWTDNASVMKAAHAELVLKGVTPPETMVNVGLRYADANKLLTVFCYFNPEEEGIHTESSTWRDSEWHRDRIFQYPEKTAYIKKLTSWGSAWAQRMRASL